MGSVIRRHIQAIGAVLILAGVFIGAVYFYIQSGPQRQARSLTDGAKSFGDLSDRLQNIANANGAAYAFEVLRLATFPPNTDLHLLGHVVGDELYKQQGISGIEVCTNEFRNACSHTIVVGAFDEFGEAALSQITEVCKRAPGGTGAYTMCFHGLGHGIFAYYGYSLPETIAVCRKTATEGYSGREYHECVGGAIMELMGGGGHDKAAWQMSRAKYLSLSDPLAPCDTSVIPDELKGMCYQYLTPHLFMVAGANLARPQPVHFKKAFGYCSAIPEARAQDRKTCYEGIGKEFVGLAVQRDIRALDNPPVESLRLIHDWCRLAPASGGREACKESVVSNLYWGSERGVGPAIAFCSVDEEDKRATCLALLREETEKYGVPSDTAQVCSLLESTDLSCEKKNQ